MSEEGAVPNGSGVQGPAGEAANTPLEENNAEPKMSKNRYDLSVFPDSEKVYLLLIFVL